MNHLSKDQNPYAITAGSLSELILISNMKSYVTNKSLFKTIFSLQKKTIFQKLGGFNSLVPFYTRVFNLDFLFCYTYCKFVIFNSNFREW